MRSRKCQFALEKIDAYRSEALTEAELEAFELHLSSCGECREGIRAVEMVESGLEQVPINPIMVRRISLAAAESTKHTKKTLGARTGKYVFAFAAATVAILTFFFLSPLLTEAPTRRVELSSKASQQSPISPRDKKSDSLPMEIGSTEDGRRFVEVFKGTALWMDDGAGVGARKLDKDSAVFELRQGRVVAVIGDHEPGFSFVVVTPSGANVLATGTVFAVEVNSEGDEEARVLEGTVTVSLREGASRKLTAGHRMIISSLEIMSLEDSALQRDGALAFGSGPTVPDTFPEHDGNEAQKKKTVKSQSLSHLDIIDEAINAGRYHQAYKVLDEMPPGDDARLMLVKLARAYRRAGMYENAADTYARLIREYSGSQSAVNASVSLGQMELDTLGRPDMAVTHFAAYLNQAPHGYLAEAARHGRIRALERSGNYAAAIVAIDDFTKNHPAKKAPLMMLRRGEINLKLNRCSSAMQDFKEVARRWPGTPEAKKATAQAKCP